MLACGQELEPAGNRRTDGLLGIHRRSCHRSSRRNATVSHRCPACPRVSPSIIRRRPASADTERYDRACRVRSVEGWTNARACQVELKVEASVGEKASLHRCSCLWFVNEQLDDTPRGKEPLIARKPELSTTVLRPQCSRRPSAPCCILLHPAPI